MKTRPVQLLSNSTRAQASKPKPKPAMFKLNHCFMIRSSKKQKKGRSTAVSKLAPDPAALGLIPSVPEIFSEENIVDVATVHCPLLSGQWTVA